MADLLRRHQSTPLRTASLTVLARFVLTLSLTLALASLWASPAAGAALPANAGSASNVDANALQTKAAELRAAAGKAAAEKLEALDIVAQASGALKTVQTRLANAVKAAKAATDARNAALKAATTIDSDLKKLGAAATKAKSAADTAAAAATAAKAVAEDLKQKAVAARGSAVKAAQAAALKAQKDYEAKLRAAQQAASAHTRADSALARKQNDKIAADRRVGDTTAAERVAQQAVGVAQSDFDAKKVVKTAAESLVSEKTAAEKAASMMAAAARIAADRAVSAMVATVTTTGMTSTATLSSTPSSTTTTPTLTTSGSTTTGGTNTTTGTTNTTTGTTNTTTGSTGTTSGSTTTTTVKFNDDKYPNVGPNDCTPPAGLTCTQNCTKTSGKGGRYVLPNNGRCAGVLAGSGYKCVNNAITLAQCCNFCTNSTSCSFFLHYVPAAPTCSGCGVCFTYSPGVAPKCATATVNGRLNANASTVGKPCPYTKHDPHFRGAHGTRFEFNGAPEKTYCLITDRSLHVNMKMRGYYDTRTIGASLLRNGLAVRTWIRELGYVWKGADGVQHSFRLASRNGKSDKRDNGFLALIEYDGRVLPSLEPGESYQLDGGLDFTFKGYETEGGGFFDVDAYTIRIGTQLVMDVKLRPAHPLLQTPDDAQVHLNVNFRHVSRTGHMHGIMGQTYREGRQQRAIDYTALSKLLHTPFSADGDNGSGFLDGKAPDYETTSVLATDCGYSAFTASE